MKEGKNIMTKTLSVVATKIAQICQLAFTLFNVTLYVRKDLKVCRQFMCQMNTITEICKCISCQG